MNEFTLPISGKMIRWKPLSVGQYMDIVAANRRDEQKHLIPIQSLVARVQHYDGRDRADGKGPPLTLQDVREWDEQDFVSLSEEVDMKEAERRLALQKKREPNGNTQALRVSIDEAQIALNRVAACLGTVLEQAMVMEEQSSPLAARS